jgi:glycosyltransferase involved in cell wall biosynthesis
MPSRSRLAGLEVEGLGIVYLEASACGLAVIGGSRWRPDAVLEGETGYAVDGRYCPRSCSSCHYVAYQSGISAILQERAGVNGLSMNGVGIFGRRNSLNYFSKPALFAFSIACTRFLTCIFR